MDCDYVLVGRCGFNQDEETVHFNASTPEDALDHGRRIVVDWRKEFGRNHPLAPDVVRAVLYRGFCEFNGRDFIMLKIDSWARHRTEDAHRISRLALSR